MHFGTKTLNPSYFFSALVQRDFQRQIYLGIDLLFVTKTRKILLRIDILTQMLHKSPYILPTQYSTNPDGLGQYIEHLKFLYQYNIYFIRIAHNGTISDALEKERFKKLSDG